jgi:DNA-binding LacI/PurR family transcriptional regulator
MGFRKAMQEATVPIDPALVVQGDWTFESGYELGRTLLLRQPPPTAIFALSEQMALGVLEAAQSLGRRVPDDLAIVTTEDSPWVDHVHPRLSAVHVPMYEVGARAVEVLLALLQHPTRDPQQIILATTFIVRESSAPASGQSGATGTIAHSSLPARDDALLETAKPREGGGADIDHG